MDELLLRETDVVATVPSQRSRHSWLVLARWEGIHLKRGRSGFDSAFPVVSGTSDIAVGSVVAALIGA